MKTYCLIFMAFIVLTAQQLFAQQLSPFVISTDGGFSSNSSGMLSYTAGEMAAVETYTTTGNILTQGFQQAWDFNTATYDNPSSGFAFEVYPNPSNGNFQFVSFADHDKLISIRVMDIQGKTLKEFQYNHRAGIHMEAVDLQYLSQGIYFIHVRLNDRTAIAAYQFTGKINIVR